LSAIFSPAVEITVTTTTAQVQQTYSIVFTAEGTAPGTEWSVALGGQTKSSTGYNINFSGLSPGTYNYSIKSPSGYQVASVNLPDGVIGGASGSITVPPPNNSTTVDVSVAFQQVQQTYSAQFTGSGQPSGAEWSVTLGGHTESTTSNVITFSGLDPGTYNFSIEAPSGYEVESVTFPDGSTGGASGTVTVPFQGYNAGLFVHFEKTQATGITFVESGLPEEMYLYGNLIATNWSVVVDGTTYSGTAGSPIEVAVTAGVSHTFKINDARWSNSRGNVVTYTPSPASGTATAGQTVNVTYTPSQY